MNDLFIGVGVGIEQTLYDLLLPYGPGDNFRNILRLYLEITDFLRVNNDNRTPLTKTMATGLPDVHLGTEALFFNLLFNTRGNFSTTRSMAGRSGTEGNTGFIRVSFRQDIFPEFFQFSG